MVTLIYDKSGRELRHRILLSFFVVEILAKQESVAKLKLHDLGKLKRKIKSNTSKFKLEKS